ncbi:DUF2752 domain-containing protein [Aestuariibaculum sediminum]|uniref:DUF2752 domain-containing protein n=1 Tax=Aestuariibaculum sediminum TaxID=2770637 RepID=A0A8J6Q8Q6_9FLAO|nr:DUF2752 domain-containing protein [Aestuariibaculum sediminum]MBD0831777.1 DUF2752 domain-containing protein [Aestuariibaculum sediminum]
MSGIEEYMLPCLNKKFFGVDCPGCGMQRSLLFILQGKFEEAFIMYPAIYTIVLMFIFLGLHIKFRFDNGHHILVGLFLLNFTIIITNYIYKFF